jgi:hypothetical protein
MARDAYIQFNHGRLVFVDALALRDGESIGEIVNRGTPRVATELAVGPSRDRRWAVLERLPTVASMYF